MAKKKQIEKKNGKLRFVGNETTRQKPREVLASYNALIDDLENGDLNAAQTLAVVKQLSVGTAKIVRWLAKQ